MDILYFAVFILLGVSRTISEKNEIPTKDGSETHSLPSPKTAQLGPSQSKHPISASSPEKEIELMKGALRYALQNVYQQIDGVQLEQKGSRMDDGNSLASTNKKENDRISRSTDPRAPPTMVKIRRRLLPIDPSKFFRSKQTKARKNGLNRSGAKFHRPSTDTTTTKPTSTTTNTSPVPTTTTTESPNYEYDYDYFYDSYDEIQDAPDKNTASSNTVNGFVHSSNAIPLAPVHLQAFPEAHHHLNVVPVQPPTQEPPFRHSNPIHPNRSPVHLGRLTPHAVRIPERPSIPARVVPVLHPDPVQDQRDTFVIRDDAGTRSTEAFEYDYQDDDGFFDVSYEYYDEASEEEKDTNIFNQFSYGYKVDAKESGNFQSRKEERDGETVSGSYEVALPDGRIQIVTYVADSNGFRADVTYREATTPSPVEPKPEKTNFNPSNRFSQNTRRNKKIKDRKPVNPNQFITPTPVSDFRVKQSKVFSNPRPTPVDDHYTENPQTAAVTPPPSIQLTPRPVFQPIPPQFINTSPRPRQPFNQDFDLLNFSEESNFKKDDRDLNPNIRLRPIFQPRVTTPVPLFHGDIDNHIPRFRPKPKPVPPPGHREVARIPPNPFLSKPFNINDHKPVRPEPKKISFQRPSHPARGPPFNVLPARFSNELIPIQDPLTFDDLLFSLEERPQNRDTDIGPPSFRKQFQIPRFHPKIVPVAENLNHFNERNRFRKPQRKNKKGNLNFTPDVPLSVPSPNPFKVIVQGTQSPIFKPTRPVTTTPPPTSIPVTLHPVTPVPLPPNAFLTPDYDYYDQFPFAELELLKTTSSPVTPINTLEPAAFLFTDLSQPTTPVPPTPPPIIFQYESADGTPSPPLLYNPKRPVFITSFGQTHAVPLLLPVSNETPNGRQIKKRRLSESERTLYRQDIYPQPFVHFT